MHLQLRGLPGLASAAVWTEDRAGQHPGLHPGLPPALGQGSDSGITYQQLDVAMSTGPGNAEGETNRELGKLPRTAPYRAVLQLGGNTHRPLLSVNDRCRPMLRGARTATFPHQHEPAQVRQVRPGKVVERGPLRARPGHGGEDDGARSLAAMVTSLTGGRGGSSVVTCLVGKPPTGRRGSAFLPVFSRVWPVQFRPG